MREWRPNEGTDVPREFETPEDIRCSSKLSDSEKIALLKSWEFDLREVLVASEEGMNVEGGGRAAETLCRVRAALQALGAARPIPGVSNKAGSS